ncbi:protein YLS7 [Citrus sinensis]|uniref:Protein YLS7 n=1 Tax=Citrus sinensis TaxID=2711 RepID=A0ACB8HTY7_CITSI|nr:protein YLS7 [Citrus sinensis]
MTLAHSPRGPSPMAAFPQSLSSILVSVGGLAMFLVFASLLLVSSPIGSTVRVYFTGFDKKLDLPISPNNWSFIDNDVLPLEPSLKDAEKSNSSSVDLSSGSRKEEEARNGSVAFSYAKDVEIGKGHLGSSENSGSIYIGSNNTNNLAKLAMPALPSPPPSNNNTQIDFVASGCDLYHGSWFYDSSGPVYTNNTCPVITQMQNCQGNGRPDKEYENWRWRPAECDLPRFDGKKFLELMRGKTLAFIGDSVARNQMESMLCLLWQVEVPKNRGNRRMQRCGC